MNNILRLILTLFFDSDNILFIVIRALFILGAWKLL